jgi:quinol monooxygenase YgiN
MSFVAISKVTYPANMKQEIQAVGLEMLPLARKQAGFISVAFHQSDEKDETMMVWEWETKSHHESCMQSKDWGALMERHGATFSQEAVQFILETYERLG